ncbi:hypothetical protein JAAARDRAFT_187678 [Jaapia argillacea MUCL 33604]|uniref:Long chronological lifespan protein 2 n=1 Tax=Jaapia argillacea MUCL 33604 TaxID=933084 RepID=A0A067QDV0_9AGAM|nr:hypothetical protein JAAARDRAFT_187678 [Jaapia argillacea MUCL 33604]
MLSRHLLLLLTLLAVSLLASAQFQFFEQMFGHGQQQQQQQRPSGASQWAAHADAVPCSQYLCPTSLLCVPNPTECPCPSVEDVKCLVPDAQVKGGATVLCVRGINGCADVEKLARKK